MPEQSYPPISPGMVVKTTQPNMNQRKEWTDEGWVQRKWDVYGSVVTHHDSHGLCYDVRHADGTEGYYDPSELEVVGKKILQPDDFAVLMHHERKEGEIVGIWRLGRDFINSSYMDADHVIVIVDERDALIIEPTKKDGFVASWNLAPERWGRVSELDLKPVKR